MLDGLAVAESLRLGQCHQHIETHRGFKERIRKSNVVIVIKNFKSSAIYVHNMTTAKTHIFLAHLSQTHG